MQKSPNTAEDLLPLIYAAALDNTVWAEFCDGLHELTGAPAIQFSHDVATPNNLGLLGAGWDPDFLLDYEQYYGDLNPWMAMNATMPVGFVGMSDYALARDLLFQTEFYNDWLRPQGNLVTGSATICYRNEHRFLALAATCRARNHEQVLPKVVDALTVLGPHVTRAIEISSVLKNGDHGQLEHLQVSRHAIITIRQSGHTDYVNPAAERFLRHCPRLSLNGSDKLTAYDEEVQKFISQAIHAMQTQCFASTLHPISLHDADFGQTLMRAHIFPREIEGRFPERVWSDPVVGCFVITGLGGVEELDTVRMLISGFRATRAEARLGQALLSGQSLYEFAEQNSVSRHTVRNQMRALLHKTGSRNQADFIRKISAFISPFEVF